MIGRIPFVFELKTYMQKAHLFRNIYAITSEWAFGGKGMNIKALLGLTKARPCSIQKRK